MQHLSIVGYGVRVGIKSNRMVVHGEDSFKEYPLNTLKTVNIMKGGISISSDLLLACSVRGIKVFLSDFKGDIVCSLSGAFDHAIAGTRKVQFTRASSEEGARISQKLISAKIANQRAVLLYFSKARPETRANLTRVAESLSQLAGDAEKVPYSETWRENLMGVEGSAARIYFDAARETGLTTATFLNREGRGSMEIMNAALNYGYAILQTAIWTAVITAGLEPWIGFLHTARPGKPSLVLDLMEEYRPWVVDRTIFKMKAALEKENELSTDLRRRIIDEVRGTLQKSYPYRSKRVRLEVILQRQIYRLIAELAGESHWQPYRFKW